MAFKIEHAGTKALREIDAEEARIRASERQCRFSDDASGEMEAEAALHEAAEAALNGEW
jgi:hypothetical protein